MEFGSGEMVCSIILLVIQDELLGTKSPGGHDGVAGVTLDDIRHHGRASSQDRGDRKWYPSRNQCDSPRHDFEI